MKKKKMPSHLAYKVDIRWSDEDQRYIARAPELDGVVTHGSTLEEAARMAQEAIELHLESLIEDGDPIPEPVAHRKFSGKYPLRMPRDVHEDAFLAAQSEGISFNEFVVQSLRKASRNNPSANRQPAIRCPRSTSQFRLLLRCRWRRRYRLSRHPLRRLDYRPEERPLGSPVAPQALAPG